MGRPLLCAIALFSLMLAAPSYARDAQDLSILRITPEGEDVTAARQIVLEFNRPVVPLGAMERDAKDLGISIEPPVNCQWRWLNTAALSCNLDEKDSLTPSTRYMLRVEPKIAAEDGAVLAESVDHSFTTERPRVTDIYVPTWNGPGLPVFRLSFNLPVTRKSAQDHLFFTNASTNKRTPAKITKDENDDTPAEIRDGQEARLVWMVTPADALPVDTKATLQQETGLLASTGDQTGQGDVAVQEFFTYPAFSFNGVYCFDKNNLEILVSPAAAQSEDKLCNPMMPVSLSFSAPVLRSQLADTLDISPTLGTDSRKSAVWGENRDWSRLSDTRATGGGDFRIGLPIGLKAAQDYTIAAKGHKPSLWQRLKSLFTGEDVVTASRLRDEFGRALPPFSLSFATGHRNPNYELVYRDAVLEKGVDSDIPLYVNNLRNFTFDFKAVNAARAWSGKTPATPVPDVTDKQFAVPLGLRGMLGGKSGALYGRLSTSPEALNKWDGANRLFAQVTPYNVHAKLGHFRSIVWVSDLSTGKPVANAKVSVYKGRLSNPGPARNTLSTLTTDENGIAVLPGLSTLDPDLSGNRAWKDEDMRLMVRVEKDGDMALLPISYDYEVSLWGIATDIYADTAEKYGHMKAWGMTAQGVYRAGDTIQYKLYVRDQDNDRFTAPPQSLYTLVITDPTGKSVARLEKLFPNAFGTISGEYAIPQTAAVGWYNFKLETTLRAGPKDIAKSFYPLSVLVSDFTPAPFRVTTDLNGDLFHAGDRLVIDSAAKLHSGGSYGDAAIRTSVSLQSRPFRAADPAAKDYWFDSFEGEQDSGDLFQKEDRLNDQGEKETVFKLPEQKIAYGQLIVESSVRDDRGKSIAAQARADYAGVDRLVGLLPAEWVYTSGTPAAVKAIVVDETGKPQTGVKISATIEKEIVSAAKVKSAGSAYTSDNTVEWEKTGTCAFRSAAEGTDCTFTPESAGTYRITATIKDTKGRAHTTAQTLFVSGADYVQWNEGREYALTILPEKTDYKVGDTARYLVKNPYPGATALVTIERYGVMDSFVQVLEGSAPVIEIPVKADYVPGFYLSVVVTSPRVEAPPPETGQIDMGKPAFRAGYIKTDVTDPYKEMTVTAKAAQDVYRPGDSVRVALEARPANPGAESEPVELAVAVLDESVFDLIADGRDAFDPYHGFYNLDSLDVTNYSLLTRLIGRQKFEKKGANPGGDGGVDAGMRNLFKFVSYWNPSVPLDENGRAEIEFPAPDNLTGWRILAIATTPNDRMGLGEAGFKVNRPTEIRPVMPNQVREGDALQAGFSVMNRTDRPRTLKVTITADGNIEKGTQSKEESITLDPYKRATVLMSLTAAPLPVDGAAPSGQIGFTVTAGDADDSDALNHILPVHKSRTVQTAATYASSTENTASQSVKIPDGIYTDTGDIGVTLSPSVIGGLDGAFTYMRDYPYPCWEQKISTAIMAANYVELRPYLDEKTVWKDAKDLPAKILSDAAGYQAPNGGMAYFTAKDDYADPYLSAYTALAFTWLERSGHAASPSVTDALRTYLLAFLRKESAPSHYSKSMTATVRAVILSAYKDSGKITANDVLRLRPAIGDMSLFGKAQYLAAANAFPESAAAARETLNAILSSGVESGGKLSFNDKVSAGDDRILTTPARDNCAALDALMTYPDKALIGDKPAKMATAIAQSRGARDHFENTQENVFCTSALLAYARRFEREEPRMTIAASFADAPLGQAAFSSVADRPVTLLRPLADGDAGSAADLSLTREGQGRYYYATRLRYAAKDIKDAVNAGIEIRREYSVRKDGGWVAAKSPLSLKRGDLVKVDLFVSLPGARNFVVVDDPLPGALETVNSDLATASQKDADISAPGDWVDFGASRWSFYHRELRADSARFYADWLEPGNYRLSYTAQAVAEGTFAAPPPRAEEMYNPDTYGLGVKEKVVVGDAP